MVRNTILRVTPIASLFLFAASIFLPDSQAQGREGPIKVEISSRVVKVGTDVKVTCTITGITDPTYTFNKVIVKGDNQHYNTEQISIKDSVQSLYKRIGRFNVVKGTDGQTDVFTLIITGAQIEDSGHYVCQDNEDFSVRSLLVYRKPTNVTFVHYADNAEVTLREDEIAQLKCKIPDVLPEPDVEMTVTRDALGPKAITDDFLLAAELNSYCTENIGEKGSSNCPVHYSYTMTATNRGFRPTFLHDGKELICRVRMRDFDKDELRTSIKMNVEYAPKILCAGIWNAAINQTNVVIKCRIHANPPAAAENKTISIFAGTELIAIISQPYQSDEYSIREEFPDPNNPKISDLFLTISKITEEHFSNKFYVNVINEIGNVTKDIRIADSKWSGATSIQNPGFILPLFISYFFLFVILRQE